MANLREIIVDWITPDGPALNVFFAAAELDAGDQRDALAAFYGSYDGMVSSSYAWSVRAEGREIDDTTGTLVGGWAEPGTLNGVGVSPTEPVPDVCQVLVRWSTGFVVNGRMLKGRTYLPGLTTASTSQGEVKASDAATLAGYAATFVGAGAGFKIWHRPGSQGGSGSSADVVGSSVWTEWATQRRRRN
uniref:Uncharacterized protein n=1 Tax=uncultured prokaryote TaxID=198431 RepID=A0A0H5PV29_9ZZZZ|nr:hypothetical protein [uncultured prokaryote]